MQIISSPGGEVLTAGMDFNTLLTQYLQEPVIRQEAPRMPVREPQERAARGVEHFLSTANASTNDYNTNTFGRVSFRRVEPVREESFMVADERLQKHLESLCEQLRSRY